MPTTLLDLVTFGSVTIPLAGAAASDGLITTVALSQLVGLPEAGSTELLTDILDTRADRTMWIYRGRIVIPEDGQIIMTKVAGGGDWFLLGRAYLDDRGRPVW